MLSLGSIALQKTSFKYHLDQPCCQRRARLNHPSHTSQKQHSGSFLCREQQITPSSDRVCSRVSSPSQASLWEVILGDMYGLFSWDGGEPKMDHEENTTSELNAMFQGQTLITFIDHHSQVLHTQTHTHPGRRDMSNNIYCECLKCPLTLTGAVSVDYLSAAGLTELLDLPCCVVGVFIALSTLEHCKSSTGATLPGSYAKRERSLFKKTFCH